MNTYFFLLLLWLILLGHSLAAAGAPLPQTVLYAGGPLLEGGEPVLQDLRTSGFSTIVAWTVHVDASGDLQFNTRPLVAGGRYVGDPAWPGRLMDLKRGGQVQHVQFAVGSAGALDFHHIQALLAAGSGPGSSLQTNFRVLRERCSGAVSSGCTTTSRPAQDRRGAPPPMRPPTGWPWAGRWGGGSPDQGREGRAWRHRM